MHQRAESILWAVGLVLISACRAPPTSTPELPTATLLPLVPTSTPTAVRSELVVQPTPGPSPTPLTHIVEQGDTLLGIALQYGVELNDLLVANAGVNPRFLSVGQAIRIPSPDGGQAADQLPTATPVPLELSPVGCFRVLEGGVWCLCTAHNQTELALEGLGALITLGSARGEPLRSEPAYAPLNVLAPGKEQLLAAFFPAPVPPFDRAQAILVSAVTAADLERRYASVILDVQQSQPGPAHGTWEILGTVELEDSPIGELQPVEVVVVALDAAGRPVGFAKQILTVDRNAGFSIRVASLGPAIGRVEVYAEAPIPPGLDG